MPSQLLEIFSDIKNIIINNRNLQPYNMEPIIERLTAIEVSDENTKYIQAMFVYVSCMKTSIESIGTKIIEMQRYIDIINSGNTKSFEANQKKFEDILKAIFVIIDDFIDSMTAFSRFYQIKGQEYDFIRSVMMLRSKRDLLMKLGNEYMGKLIKGINDNSELRFFLGDFLDSIIYEAHRLQINKLLKMCKPIIYKNNTVIEELW